MPSQTCASRPIPSKGSSYELLPDHICLWIRHHRRAAKLTTRQLAEAAKCNPSTIHEIETSENLNPTLGTLKAIASALGMTADELIAGVREILVVPGDESL